MDEEKENTKSSPLTKIALASAVFGAIAAIFIVLFLQTAAKPVCVSDLVVANDLEIRHTMRQDREWTLEEITAERNAYLENYYNILLLYDDEILADAVYRQEKCLGELDSMNSSGATAEEVSAQSDICNSVGVAIDESLRRVLSSKSPS